jgi:ATP/maltotriose-dependent transcriptional regulator MalT
MTFGIPHVEWSLAAAELGLRHFARCDALLRRVEARAISKGDIHLQLNERALRARLGLAQQRSDIAVGLTRDNFDDPPGPPMYGEYLATRALALAVAGDGEAAIVAADEAERMTRFVDATVLCCASRAIVALSDGGSAAFSRQLLRDAARLGAWDGVVCAVRAAPELLGCLAEIANYREVLADVLIRSNDVSLARGAGLVTRVKGTRRALSPREREIIEHVRQGQRNAEIAASLFISVGTVKRHLDHIYGKLGARGRAEAIARYAEIETGESDDEA